MMLAHAFCALLAPGAVHAAAFQWALPEPTLFAPTPDSWSPAPTAEPEFPGSHLFRRQASEGIGTCAYLSGNSESSITCANTNFVCATNTQYGVAGCCDPNPAAFSSCVIPTQCVASTGMSSSCGDAACTSNSAIIKCTQYEMTECYRWIVNYGRTIMTQHGCTNKGFTSTVQRSWQMLQSSVSPAPANPGTTTVFVTPTSTPTISSSSNASQPSLAAIIGGTVGACVFLSIIAIVIFIIYRKRKNAEDGVPPRSVTQFCPPGSTPADYSPQGYPTTYITTDHKVWSQQGPVQRSDNYMPHYPGMGATQYGIVEVDGNQQPVEAPTDRVIYEAK